jgi:peptidoglycan/xylan/chitin deacetylase (PgdA/CDA1 family)
MWMLRKRTSWVRPQVLVGLVAAACIAQGGYAASPSVLRPSQAGSVPVIRHIQSSPAKGLPAEVTAAVNCAQAACLALTFDDGPDPQMTPRVLDILGQHEAKATFFLIGSRVPGNEALVRRIHQEGHEVGNHTWSHRKISELSPQELEDEVARAQNTITAAGVPAPRLFRPPYGLFSPMIRSHISMTVVAWNIDPEDWDAKKPEEIVEHVLAHAKPGAIVDLHDIYGITADALDPILTGLEQKYHLVTVSELLDLPSGQPGIFYGR